MLKTRSFEPKYAFCTCVERSVSLRSLQRSRENRVSTTFVLILSPDGRSRARNYNFVTSQEHRKRRRAQECRPIETFQQGVMIQVGRTRAHEASAVPFISNRSPTTGEQPFCYFISLKWDQTVGHRRNSLPPQRNSASAVWPNKTSFNHRVAYDSRFSRKNIIESKSVL